eukprot:TRINITY_DN8560_c0_g1_i1.p1 TRINITY_DN8560_c0_g1~~TRINITY_DN8560_c0_g1_i1.p1  ORF type:complete len:529 (+),score=141.43 TRINITY_DN8560_c0_g1_i1:40-1626(+)
MEQVVAGLKKLLGNRAQTEASAIDLYAKDYSHHGSGHPNIIVHPQTEAEIIQIVKLCNTHLVPLIGYGAGTSLEGHTTATLGGVILSLAKMDKIIQINDKDQDVVLQPGVTFPKLNEALKKYNLHFPLDAGPNATIGGMASTGASGTKAVRYGTMKENVLNLRVVLPNGKIVRTANRARKSVSSYDLTHLFTCSEGTLGVITELTVRVHKIPKCQAAALIHFPTVKDAADTVMEMFEKEDTKSLTMVEFLDDMMMKATNLQFKMNYQEKSTLYFEFGAEYPQVLTLAEECVKRVSAAHGGSDLIYAKSEEEREQLWKARKGALFASRVLRRGVPDIQVWTTDVCVPLTKLSDCITQTKEDINQGSLLAPIVGHVGDGNFHLFILLDPTKANELEEAKKLNARLVERAIAMEGTCTGEHGVGVGKVAYLERELGKDAVELMKVIKLAIDPNDVMNPGKKVFLSEQEIKAGRVGVGAGAGVTQNKESSDCGTVTTTLGFKEFSAVVDLKPAQKRLNISFNIPKDITKANL